MKNHFDHKRVWDTKQIMDELSQLDKLKIVISSSRPPYVLSKRDYERFRVPHKGAAYFFMFYENGVSTHGVDFHPVTVSEGELLFILPNQIHNSPPMEDGIKFFTLSFAQNLLSMFPQQFLFLINPLASPKITFKHPARHRIVSLFEALNQLLHAADRENNTEIILAYLGSLMTEFNTAYFSGTNTGGSNRNEISIIIKFKLQIERDLKMRPSVASIASKLSISESKLYKLVKCYLGASPKEYLIQRLILEAQRMLYYDGGSVKELSHELGFTDPDYFSRLFKKQTGKTIGQFLLLVQDLSGKHMD